MKDVLYIDLKQDYYRIIFTSQEHKLKAIDWARQYEGKGVYAVGGWGIYFSSEDDAVMCTLACK